MNQFRELKQIPYTGAIYDHGPCSWSSYECCFTPSVLSMEEEVVYPWKINVSISHMSNVQECKLARTETTMRLPRDIQQVIHTMLPPLINRP